MQGLSSSSKKDTFEGLVVWYYKNGKAQTERHYINGKQEGNTKSYFEDGKLKSNGEVKNNTFYNGTFNYTSKGPYQVTKYENQSVTERYSYYEDSKTIAEKQIIKYFDQVQKSVYYDKKGNEIAAVNYINRSGNYLEPKDGGSIIHFSYTNDFFVKSIIAKTTVKLENSIKKETTTNINNEVIATGNLKNGYPYDGQFFKNGAITTYSNGNKQGLETCCLENAYVSVEGEYKNNSKHNGSFYNSKTKTITSYQNGILNGEKRVFDNNYQVIRLENYKKGSLDGKRITQNKFDLRLHTATYKKGKAENGEVFDFENISVYKNGKLLEKTAYDYKTKLPTEITYYDSIDNITKRLFLKDDKTYTLYYKDGSPFEGEQIQPYGLTTYKDGGYNGPFTILDKHQTIKGNYTDFKYEGEVLFINNKTQDTLKCDFKAGKPINGIDAFSGKITYKNGKKHGLFAKNLNNRNYVFDSLSAYYKNDIKIDTVKYFEKRNLVASGIYKNGTPFNGTFYDDRKRENFETYKSGIITQKEESAHYDYLKHQFFYTDGNINNEKVFFMDYGIDSLRYTLSYKKGKPNTGQRFKKDSISNYFIVTSFNKGKKEGTETFYKKPFKEFVKRYNYKNNKLSGKAQYQYVFNKNDTIEGFFKDNTPYHGTFVTENKTFLETTEFNSGSILNKKYYTYSRYSDYQYPIDSLIYKNNKPFNGLLISIIDKKEIAKLYKNSNHTETHINPSIKPYRSYKTIIHEPLKDSLAGDNPLKYSISYTNAKKDSGFIAYFYMNKKYGEVFFKNNSITKVDINEYDKKTPETIKFKLYINAEGNLINSFTAGEYMAQRIIPRTIIGEKYIALGNLQRFQFNQKSEVLTFFIDGKMYASLEMRNSKPYHGIIFEPELLGEGSYKYRLFEKAKRIDFTTHLTKAELLKKLGF